MTPDTHHAISYVELGVTDLDATRAFYESAFGWEFNDYGGAYAGTNWQWRGRRTQPAGGAQRSWALGLDLLN